MLLHEDRTEKIIQIFYAVYNELGYGFREEVYENSLAIELQAKAIFSGQNWTKIGRDCTDDADKN